MDTLSGPAATALRHFCSQAHCEEGKEEHEMTMKEYNCEMVRKERELEGKQDEFDAEFRHFKKRSDEWDQKVDDLEQDLKHKQKQYELELSELKTSVYKSKRTLKEMGEIMKRETASLQRILRKKELEIKQEIGKLRLLKWRGAESLCLRQICLIEKRDIFYRKKYAGDEAALQQKLVSVQKDQKRVQRGLVKARKSIRSFEERHMLASKELDAINAELGINDEDTATPTATAADPGPVKTLAEQLGRLQATPSALEGTKEGGGGGEIDPAAELARKFKELESKREELDADIRQKEAELQGKMAESDEVLKRVQENHAHKLSELKTDVYKSKKTLKEMGETMKRETASLQRILRMKELKVAREITMRRLSHARELESLFVRQGGLLEDEEVSLCENQEYYAGDQSALHQHLMRLRKDKNRVHQGLLEAREDLLAYEKRFLSVCNEWYAINIEMRNNDDDTATPTATPTPTPTATATTSVTHPGPVKTPAEQLGRLQATPSALEGTKEGGGGGEIDPAAELARKFKELDSKQEEFYANFYRQQDKWRWMIAEAGEVLQRERENHAAKLSELETSVYKSKKTLKEMGEIMKQETASLQQIFRKKELEIAREEQVLRHLQLRESESLLVCQIGLFEDEEVLLCEKYAGDEAALQQQLESLRKKKQDIQLLIARGSICSYEERHMSVSKELDAINPELGSNDKDTATPTPTATATTTTSAAVPGPMKMPLEPLRLLVAALEETNEGGGGGIDPAAELARKFKELDIKRDEFDADIKQKEAELQGKMAEADEVLQRERENHELKLRELKTDVYKSKRTLKEMGEIMKRETASLQRMLRMKELEIAREVIVLRHLQLRESESLFVRQIGLFEDEEVLLCEKYAGDDSALQQQLVRLRERQQEVQHGLLETRENIRGYEERHMLVSKELDAINPEPGSNDKDTPTPTVTTTTSAADPGPLKTPTQQLGPLQATPPR